MWNFISIFAQYTKIRAMIKENFIKLYENSFRENWDLPCYTDYGEDVNYTYGEVAREIAQLHLLFKHCSIRRGGEDRYHRKNNSRWCIAPTWQPSLTERLWFLFCKDFNPNDVHHIVNHSESVFLLPVIPFGKHWRRND